MKKPEIPNFAALLGELIVSIPDASRAGFVARLERTAAERYRGWAEQSEQYADGLRACANREDEIADRVEKLFQVQTEDRDLVAEVLPRARALYYETFDAHSLEDQWIIQAHAERQGSKVWEGYAAQAEDESARKELVAIAQLEVESAVYIDEILNITSTGDV
jgi:hypothetical protein